MSIRAFNYINILKINDIQKFTQQYFLVVRVNFY
jgi:hypothetical protein